MQRPFGVLGNTMPWVVWLEGMWERQAGLLVCSKALDVMLSAVGSQQKVLTR